MCPKDDLGIEYDDDVDKVLKDPKSTILSKTLKYMMQRSEVERRLAEKENQEKNEKEKFLGIF